MKSSVTYLPRDFIVTNEGLVFAVVDRGRAGERIPCFLRYRTSPEGSVRKLDTRAANDLLRLEYPNYLFHCKRRDAHLHGVGPEDVARHLRPRERLSSLIDPSYPADSFEGRTARLVEALVNAGVDIESIGVTGSVLPGYHRADSDIDLVLYDSTNFHRARQSIPTLIARGIFCAMDEQAWRVAYERRGCALDYDVFRWHETRKLNKARFEGTKFDLSLCTESSDDPPVTWHKLGAISLTAKVSADEHAFDYPARLGIAHPIIKEVVAFTATYTGQALVGEYIAVSGMLEQAEDETQRVVVGSDREAAGQSIRVVPGC